MKNKTVLLEIVVPEGEYCWGGSEHNIFCEYFDCEGGHPECRLNIGDPDFDQRGWCKKPSSCANLKMKENNCQ